MTNNIYPLMGRVALPLLVLSLVSNLAVLISPLFMMQVLDRVIPSGNIATLLLLGALALAALIMQAGVEGLRDLAVGRLARWSENVGVSMALSTAAGDQNNVIRQVANFSSFLSGPALLAALSAPWIPIFLLVLWLLHPAFVCLLLVMSVLVLGMRAATQALGQSAMHSAAACAAQEDATLRSASAAEARDGLKRMAHNLRLRFAGLQQARHLHVDQSETANVMNTAFATLMRNTGQIAALGVGAWLVTLDLISAGGMIAGSIIISKAYMAIEALFNQMPSIKKAKADYLSLSAHQPEPTSLEVALDRPSGAIKATGLIYPRGGGALPRIDRVSFDLKPGELLAIVGNSGSGKSTLLRAISGIAPAPIGSVFLDEHEVRGLTGTALFDMAGYLPQRPIFETGTIGEIISCFDPDPNPEAITTAAQVAGVHGLICALPDSFQTDLGREPYALSAGQMQRVALARAIYAKPKYLFLDEPNAMLDAEGERALGQTLLRLKRQGMTIVIVVHRSGILSLADKVLHLDQGRVSDFGPKSEVLGRLSMGGQHIELPVLETSQLDLQDWIASQFTRDGDDRFRYDTQVAATELQKLACANCPADTLMFSRFRFRFLSDASCELSMVQPCGTDMADQVEGVRKKLRNSQGSLVTLTQDEVHLAKLTQMSFKLDITSEENATHYCATILRSDECVETNLKSNMI